MRVTFLNDDWRRNGGVASYLHRLAKALTARGDAVQIVHADNAAPDVPGVRSDYIEVCTAYGASSSHPATLAAIAAADAFAPDIVHVHSCSNFALEAALGARYRATKSLHVYDFCPSNTKFHHAKERDCVYPTSAMCLPRLGYLRCTTSRRPNVWVEMYRRATDTNANNARYAKLIVASDYVRAKALATGYPAAQVDTIPYFVDAAAASTPEAGLVVTGGRLVREKGIDLFLQALTNVRQPWRAIIAGDGMEAAALKARARALGLDGAVTFAGWQDEAQMAALYRRAWLVVMPSRWPEPSGIIGLEAMAHGRPVAAFATGGIPEWLEHGVTGLRAAPGDAPALASAISTMLDDAALAARMGEAGRASAARTFSSAAHLTKLDALYGALPAPA
jgi:glycosyltransferase involved in cell wall biosynthesis